MNKIQELTEDVRGLANKMATAKAIHFEARDKSHRMWLEYNDSYANKIDRLNAEIFLLRDEEDEVTFTAELTYAHGVDDGYEDGYVDGYNHAGEDEAEVSQESIAQTNQVNAIKAVTSAEAIQPIDEEIIKTIKDNKRETDKKIFDVKEFVNETMTSMKDDAINMEQFKVLCKGPQEAAEKLGYDLDITIVKKNK